MLLIMQNEAKAFHGFCYIIDNLLPGYFTKQLTGLLIDVFIMKKIIKTYAKNLFLHCEKHNISLGKHRCASASHF